MVPDAPAGAGLDEAKAIVDGAARDAGRDPSQLGMEGRVTWRGDDDRIAEDIRRWSDYGATHLSVNTMGAGLRTVDEHLAVLETVADGVALG